MEPRCFLLVSCVFVTEFFLFFGNPLEIALALLYLETTSKMADTWVSELRDQSKVDTTYIASELNPADIFVCN